jgi:hypothetical protein
MAFPNGPPPNEKEWKRWCRTATAKNLREIRQHAIENLEADERAWKPLLLIAEQMMRERGITFD